MIRKDERMRLTRKNGAVSLAIRDLRPEDAGETTKTYKRTQSSFPPPFAGSYVCEVETYGEPIQQTNELEVLGEYNICLLFCIIEQSNTIWEIYSS